MTSFLISLFRIKGRQLNPRLLIALVLPLLGLIVVVYLIQKQTFFFGRAASISFLEAEKGVISGPVSVKSDNSVSGGQYVEFGTLQSQFQPREPYYATFFYLWYKNPNPDGVWSYWTDHGNNPPNTWFSHYLPDPNPTSFDPRNELYSSNNYEIFKWQVAKMAEAKQEVAIASWWGQNTREDIALNNIVNSFMARADNPYPNLRWSIYYEDEGFSDPSVATLVADLTYIKNKYTQSPYFLKVNSRPVIFVYAGSSDGVNMNQRWYEANSQMGNYFYTVLKVYLGYSSSPYQPDSWHQYAPATRNGQQAPYYFYVSPGFWLDDGSSERLTRNATEFENAVNSMVAANTRWKLTQTWNEWGEGSSVEPGEKIKFNASTGKDEPDTSANQSYAFHNLYVDILNRNLPPLEAGTGGQSLSPTPTSSFSPTPTPTTTTGSNPVVVAAGDIACGADSSGAACREMATSELIGQVNPNAVLLLGDTQYEQGQLAYYLGNDPFCNSNPPRCFGPTWGRFKSITRPAVGNHEYLTNGASGYFDYFNGVGNPTGPAGDRNKGYYAFDLGSWRLYTLNSQCSAVGGCGAGSPQETWLRNDLAANPKTCVLAFFHHPLFSSGGRATTSVRPLVQALYDYNAEIVLAGHDHTYERFAPQNPTEGLDITRGIREFVVGTGGRNHTSFTTVAANSEVRNDNTFGILKLVLRQGAYDFEFIPIAGSTFTDKGSANCH